MSQKLLDRSTLDACREEPMLASVRTTHVVEIPQRVLRQPRRRTGAPNPPLVAMLDAGRGAGDVRIHLYLWLWACLSTRQFGELDLRKTTGEWARLINLLPGETRHNQGKRVLAARRVGRALDYLEASTLITRPGDDVVRLLDPSRSGFDYRPWTKADIADRERERDRIATIYLDRTDFRRGEYWEDPPLRLPGSLWTSGVISALSGPALLVFLILWDYERTPGSMVDVPKSRPYEYPISHASWFRGAAQLEHLGVVERHAGALVFPATNRNPRIEVDRHRTRWKIRHSILETLTQS